MFVSLCAREFDPDGAVVVDALPSSELGNLSRRVNRVKILDGGAFLNDTGQTDADRTIVVKYRDGAADTLAIKRLLTLYPLLTISTREGCFLGVAESLSSGNDGEFNLRFLVQERLDNGYAG